MIKKSLIALLGAMPLSFLITIGLGASKFWNIFNMYRARCWFKSCNFRSYSKPRVPLPLSPLITIRVGTSRFQKAFNGYQQSIGSIRATSRVIANRVSGLDMVENPHVGDYLLFHQSYFHYNQRNCVYLGIILLTIT
jgi:hypothetical protein